MTRKAKPPHEGGGITRAGLETDDCHDLTSSYGVNTYLAEIDRGEYEPCPGSVGDLLAEAHPSSDPWTSCRAVAQFAKIATRSEGVWWAMILAADPATLSPAEEITVDVTWRQRLAGEWPGRRRHGAR